MSSAQRPDLSVRIGDVVLKNPVMTASGTFGAGREYSEFFDLSRLGAVVTKGIAPVPWTGNEPIRVCETPSGMLNAIGLMGAGVETFIREDLPFLRQFDTKIIVNVCGHADEDYFQVVERLAGEDADLLEINISCPNVKEGCLAFGTDPAMVEYLTREIKRRTDKPVIMKLSPNVTSVAEIARAAENGGADAVSLINTITGMKIDVRTRRFVLANRTGGLSGPAIHPVAVRMVYECAQAVKIPVIGMGGIATAEDAVEMMLAGAAAVAVGTATFRDPLAAPKIADGIEAYLARYGIASARELTGAVTG